MPASTAAVRATHKVGLEEGVVVVVVDGVEMRGGNRGLEGRKEGRSEMLFPQNSELIISPL